MVHISISKWEKPSLTLSHYGLAGSPPIYCFKDVCMKYLKLPFLYVAEVIYYLCLKLGIFLKYIEYFNIL